MENLGFHHQVLSNQNNYNDFYDGLAEIMDIDRKKINDQFSIRSKAPVFQTFLNGDPVNNPSIPLNVAKSSFNLPTTGAGFTLPPEESFYGGFLEKLNSFPALTGTIFGAIISPTVWTLHGVHDVGGGVANNDFYNGYIIKLFTTFNLGIKNITNCDQNHFIYLPP